MKYKLEVITFNEDEVIDLGSWSIDKVIREMDGNRYVCLLKQPQRSKKT